MTSRFDRALAHTLRFEGGFSSDPDDPGGATNYGVSLRFLLARGELEAFDYDHDGDVDADDVRVMTREDAAEIYLNHFWAGWMGNEEVDELLAAKAFDFGVNMGPGQAGRLLQRALNELLDEPLRVDGIVGEKTEGVIAAISEDQVIEVVGDLEDWAARFYYGLAEKRAASRKYLFGWLRRAYARPAG